MLGDNRNSCIYKKDNQYGFFDFATHKTVGELYGQLHAMGRGCHMTAIGKDKANKVLINAEGRIVTPQPFATIDKFKNGLARVTDENRNEGFIDDSGQIVGLLQNTRHVYSDGLRPQFKKSGKSIKWGFGDATGKFKIPARFLHRSTVRAVMSGVWSST